MTLSAFGSEGAPDVTDEALVADIEVISFEIGGQEFCIDIRSVREIRGWTPITPMPQTPDFIMGIIILRGGVIPVVDLRVRLGLGRTEPTARHVIVVIQWEDRVAGLLVDAVQESFRATGASLQAPPEVGGPTEGRFVDAILAHEGRMISRLVVSTMLPPRLTDAA